MKILFVCKWNVGRSQIAEELFNQYCQDHIALSAGTHASKFKGKKLKTFAKEVVQVLKEKNIDAGNKMPIQLTRELVDFADRIMVMADKSDLPEYAIDSNKITFWDIADGGGEDYEFHVKMRDQIDTLVRNLIPQLA